MRRASKSSSSAMNIASTLDCCTATVVQRSWIAKQLDQAGCCQMGKLYRPGDPILRAAARLPLSERAKMSPRGGLAELADADGSKSSDRKVMGVQVPRPLPPLRRKFLDRSPVESLPLDSAGTDCR